MALSGYDFKEYEDEIFTDELVKDAMELLQERYDKMANWLEENRHIEECYCGSTEFEYDHEGATCKKCGHREDMEVPYPASGGVVASRKLESVIKELFSFKMAEQRKKEKPKKKQLDKLPFSVVDFDSGEYTISQVEFLKDRFETLVEENNIANGVDKFYIRSLVIQELKIMKLERQDAIQNDVDSKDMKRQYDIYNKLASKVKANRVSRDDNSKQSFFKDMEKKLENTNIDKIIEKYTGQQEEIEKYREKANKRKKEVGNPY